MKPTPEYVIVKMKEFFNDKIDVGNGKFLTRNTRFNPEFYVKMEAEVVAIPDRFGGPAVYHVYPGTPSPQIGNRDYKVWNLYHSKNKWVNSNEFEIDIEVGDVVFFHFNTIRYPGTGASRGISYMDTDEEGYEYHRVPIGEIFFRKRNGEIKMLFGRALVTPIREKTQDVKIKGLNFKAQIGDHGLIMSTEEKRKPLEGILKHISDFAGPENRENLNQGDRILYLPESEFENEIDGEITYLMMYRWIVAKYEDGDYVPLGDYVKIEVEDYTDGIKRVPNSPVISRTGRLLMHGPDCGDETADGNRVVFNQASAYFANYENNVIFVRHKDLFFLIEDDLQEAI